MHRTLHLHLDLPSRIDIELDDRAHHLWEQIQFFEDTEDYKAYDRAWEDLLNYFEEEIKDAVFSDLGVYNATTS